MIRNILRILVVVLLFVTDVYAQGLIGQDYYALQHRKFPVTGVVKYTPSNTPIGTLDYTFGDSPTPIRTVLSSVRPSIYRVHIFNGAGLRNGVLGRYDPLYGLTIKSFQAKVKKHDTKILSFLRERTLLYRNLQGEFPHTKIIFSPILEHNMDRDSWRILADEVLKVWPSVQLVNSPEGTGSSEKYRGAWLERHGNKPKMDAEIYSLDGSDATDIDIVAWLKRVNTPNTKISFIWARVYNCRNQGPFEDPRARTSCPITSTLNMLNHIQDVRPPAFEYVGGGCRKIEKFDSRYIWKPLPEDKGNGDTRVNYPVVIVPGKVSKAIALDFKGNKTGTLGFYGPFDKLRNRYYSSFTGGTKLAGYGFERKAIEGSGSPYTYIKVGSTCYGPLLGGMRQGDMRDK